MKTLTSLDCTECGILFNTGVDLLNHNETKHTRKQSDYKKTETTSEEFTSEPVKILPDLHFLTKNTADLKLMLESIPEKHLWFEENVFEKDFKLVMNSVKSEPEPASMNRYQCDMCLFRGTSRRCLKTLNTFVHGTTIYR